MTSKNRRTKRGFSLVTVLLMGMCATLWLAAMTATIIPAYQKTANNKIYGQLRSAAESSIDFTIDQITTSLRNNTATPYDDDTPGTPWKTSTIPSTVHNVPNVTVTVTVKNTPPNVNAAVYDPILAAGPLSQYSRIIEATASNGTIQRSFRVVLKPLAYVPNTVWNPSMGVTPTSSFNPMSQYSAFAPGAVSLGRGTTTDGYTGQNPFFYNSTKITANTNGSGALGGDVASYKSVSLSGSGSGVTVGGSVDVPETGGVSSSASGSGTNSTSVNRYVTVNGNATGLSDGSSGGTSNVGGMANNSAGYPDNIGLGARGTALESGLNTSQNPVASAPPTAPYFKDSSNAVATQNLGDLDLTSTTITITNSASAPPAGGYTIPSSGSISIQPGNYSVGSITVSGSGRITVASDVSSSQPVRFFISDQSSSPTAMDLSNSGIRNQSSVPSNLQIYYNGDRNISIAQTNRFSSVLYAPNAGISTGSSSGAALNVFGSIVGGSLSTQNTAIHYDHTMTSSASNGYSASLTSNYKNLPSSLQSKSAFGYYSIASWQEWPAGKSLPGI